MTRFLNVPLDVSDVFLMTFMILLDSYMEPTRVGSDNLGGVRSNLAAIMNEKRFASHALRELVESLKPPLLHGMGSLILLTHHI